MRASSPLMVEDGFSLLELLVAVAVLSLAAVTLLEHQGQGARLTAMVQEQALAATVAENRFALLSTQEDAPRVGSRSGVEEQLGVTYHWLEHVRAIPGSELMSLEVTVTAEGGDQQLARLTGFRRAAP
ncbi:type II secretion system minor pseudopilin GspI [Kordiimonas aestuarii]|uniref:type II secretion system minor pseudopilin GspI n=1 Tax=Kordiimonas aestuarii TaxID=1005925 RepID=UPI0021D36847|nr:type II secretion system minor pseudopilin GspI [Kordiimonas aestuarii]